MNECLDEVTKMEVERHERYVTGMKKSSISRDGQVDQPTDMNSHGCAINNVFIDTHYRLFMTIAVRNHIHHSFAFVVCS